MKLRTLIEAILPTLLDEMGGYSDYELSLVATRNGETIAQSLLNIRATSHDDYTVLSTEVQIIESP